MKLAIIVIDVLEDFFKEGRLKDNRPNMVKNINELTSFARDHKVPIIWVRQEFKKDLSDAFLAYRKNNTAITIEGTPGAQLLSELIKDSSDYEVIKKRYSAFFKTSLDELLTKLGVDTLIICGVNTHACIRTAVIDAYQRDYEVVIATNCTDSYDLEHHRVSLNYLTKTISKAISNEEIFHLLSSN